MEALYTLTVGQAIIIIEEERASLLFMVISMKQLSIVDNLSVIFQTQFISIKLKELGGQLKIIFEC